MDKYAVLSERRDSFNSVLPGDSPLPWHSIVVSFAITQPKYPLPSVSPPSDTRNRSLPIWRFVLRSGSFPCISLVLSRR